MAESLKLCSLLGRENSGILEEYVTLAAPLSLSFYFSPTRKQGGSDLPVRFLKIPEISPLNPRLQLLPHVPSSPKNRGLGWGPLQLTVLSLSLQPSLKSLTLEFPKTKGFYF